MYIQKFSLPEGCDLKLKVYDATVDTLVTYRGEDILSLGGSLMGSTINVRRGILGTSFVYHEVHGFWCKDLRYEIIDRIKNFRSASDILEDNMKHFEGMSGPSDQIEMYRAIARQSFEATRSRIHQQREIVRNTTDWRAIPAPTPFAAEFDGDASPLDVPYLP